jgi:hypothetical protein
LLPAWGVVGIEEVVGIGLVVWMVERFGIRRAAERDAFLRTGRLVAAPRVDPRRRPRPQR